MSRPDSLRLLTALCLAAATPWPAAAADPFSAGTPFVRAYQVSDGLPQNTVHCLLVDREGFFLAGTQEGVARYDGRRWVDVELPTRRRSSFVRDLLEDSSGDLWVATQAGGLLRRSGAKWTVYDPDSSPLPDLRVNTLAEAPGASGRAIWIGTHAGGLARLEGATWKIWTVADGLPGNQIWDLLVVPEDGGDRLWIATEAGPARMTLPEGPIEVPAGAPTDSASALELLRPDAAGAPEVWVGLYGGGLARWREGEWTRLGREQGLPSLFVTDLAPRPERGGELWVATDGGGVAAWREGELVEVPLGAAFSSNAAYRVLETTSEQGAAAVWIGTRNSGLLRLTAGYWRSLVPFPEIPRSPVASLLLDEDAPGGAELWLGTDGFGLARWKGGTWQRYDRSGGALGHDSVLALAKTARVGSGRRVWAGTRNGGLSSWDGAVWRRYDQAGGELPNDLVQVLLETRDEPGGARLWVGTREGLAVHDGGGWRSPPASEGWPRSSILALLEDVDREGRWTLWLAASTGLYRYREGALRRWAEAEGLANPNVHSLHLRTLADGRRELWMGTDGNGAFVLDPDDEASVPRPLEELGYPSLANGVIYAIVEDGTGRLYLPTNRGVVRIAPESVTGGSPTTELFTVDHGLPSSQASRGAAAVDAEGRLWIGTVGGAAAFDPAAEPVSAAPKRIHLHAELRAGEDREIEAGARIPQSESGIAFDYSLLSFFGESLTRHRTQLAGWEETPTAWSALGEREFGGLPPGSYTFRVWGRDAGGRVSGPQELAFVVLPAFWQTTLARALMAAAGLLLVLVVLRARARVHQKRERELEELVAARTSSLQRANALLIELSYVDALTAIPNRRRFDELLESEWRRAVRAKSGLAVAMVDIDHFKVFNDSYGHQKGDDCLRQVAATLADGLPRSSDAIARYGGEEFAVILPHTDLEGALQVAEALRRRIQALGIPHKASELGGVVTVSCGVAAAAPREGGDPQSLLTRADRALYQAKRGGRNRVETVA